ncbi:MAG: serine/threonine protein kinase [Myxococcaceae bacterium]|nr:serine/threonine protein kinase [Myxococcaceae bacterium]
MGHCDRCHIDVPEAASRCTQCGGELTQPEPDELLGSLVLGRYRVVRMLAEGGMGRVYLAEQSVGTVIRRVAIKVLRRQLGSDKQLVSRFAREAETLVRLTHPNTVQLFDFGALPDGTLALVMEYVEGHSLARELLRGVLSPARVERLLTQACGALQEAHAHGIVHRDLKPDNMLVAERVGHGDFIKVLDFGIAKVSTESEAAAGTKLTQQGMIIGTPPYMSPEQFSGDVIDARSDIYSLGVIAYEMLTGRLPFAAKTPWEWASRHLTGQPEELPLDPAAGLLPRHARAIREALAKKPEDRPQTVAEFLARFTSETAPASSAALPPATPGEPERASRSSTLTETVSAQLRRPGRRPALLGLVTLLLLATGALALRGRSREPRLPPQLAAPSASTSAVASAPVAANMAPSTLPTGAPLPEEAQQQVQSPRPHRAHGATDSAGQHRERRRAAQTSEPERLEPLRAEPRALEPEPVQPAAEPARRVPPVARAEEPSVAGATKRSSAVPDDLAQRIGLIRSATAGRVETAIGLFQAAAGRYGSHPALQPARAQLGVAGESRIKELISGGRCAQAQAVFRALRAIQATGQAGRAFGGACPAPP